MAVPIVSLEALTAAACAENRHAARKVAACYRVHCEWIESDTEHKHYSRYGRTEMAVALGCSNAVAEAYVSVGVALHTRLPLVKTAFDAGEIDLPRVRTVCRILDNLSDEIVKSVEDEIVEAARRHSPGPLEKEIWDILLRVAPEEAAALREFAKRFRHVSYSPAGELARIRAELTAPEAAAAWQLLEEMADTVCPKDPRGKQDRLCDAFMARMHGEPRLTCLCRRADCPKKDAELPDRRVPLTMITVDIATLIGLLANPAYLAGHGSIDPDLARELARNSQWQVLLTEAVTLAEKLGLAVQNPETGGWERRSDSEKTGAATGPEAGTATEPDADRDTDTDADADRDEGVDSAADADAATAAHGDGGMGAATDSGREADSSTEPNSSSSSAPAPAPGNTSAPAAPAAPADEVGETDHAEENDESAPVPASVPSTTPDLDAADPVRKHAATRATATATDPRGDATPDTGPAAQTEPESAPRSPARQTSPAPDTGPNCPESRSSTTASGSTTPSGSTTAGPTPGPEPATATVSSPTPKPPAEQGSIPDPVPAEAGPTDPAPGDGRPQRRVGSLTSAAALFCTHTPVGRGTRHSSALDLSSVIRRNNRTIRTPAGLYLGNASLAAALEAAIAADPTLGKSVARDPLTDRALIYRPDTLTTAAVRLRDRHCRFPDCHTPADRCQLDHVISFDHTNPLGGGWTTVNNLQCLCEFHHTVKTAGYWKAVMLPGGAILWTSTSKTTRITLPANGTAVPIIGNDLRPHIPTKPRRSGIIAYPDPPASPEPET
ncbi:HNH endonuclease signature motif containing protein [Rhodococcus sp. 14-2483-1-1]|uniref:HNH endonuclease signature motif containing protein n=1 Tax=Rhodococcus sp. 14-2483-1-1 TaxID=2023148 RepID=UPI00148254DA|nr:HNH endonuclease signature motif containing protein [Rhodococcus sp. 14-2483-1-1]